MSEAALHKVRFEPVGIEMDVAELDTSICDVPQSAPDAQDAAVEP